MESAYSPLTWPTRQTGKEAEVSTTWLYLSGKNFAPSEQEVWLSREHSFGKDETENQADEIYMNTAAIRAATIQDRRLQRCFSLFIFGRSWSEMPSSTVQSLEVRLICCIVRVFFISPPSPPPHLVCLFIVKFSTCIANYSSGLFMLIILLLKL